MIPDIFNNLPVPPALVYLLHQLRGNGIGYQLYGEIVGSNMVFVDLDREFASQLQADQMPDRWSIITPHYLSQRALIAGQGDPIQGTENAVEAVVIAFGGAEAEKYDVFKSLCEQVSYLRQMCPSRLIYNNDEPPDPMEIHELILMLKSESQPSS